MWTLESVGGTGKLGGGGFGTRSGLYAVSRWSPWLHFKLLGDAIERFVSQIFILVGMSDGVQRGR